MNRIVAAAAAAAAIVMVAGAVMMWAGPGHPEGADPGHATGALSAQAAMSPPADAVPLAVALDFVVPVYQGGAERFRTPATIDTALAEDLGKRLRRPVTIVGPEVATKGGDNAGAADLPADVHVDVRITLLDGRPLPQAVDVIPLDYRAAPMAIMRTDSPIQDWEQLIDRTVCVAAGGQHVGDLQRQYSAI